MKQQLIDLYLDWVNNWLTVAAISEHYGIDPVYMDQLISIGRDLHHQRVIELKQQ